MKDNYNYLRQYGFQDKVYPNSEIDYSTIYSTIENFSNQYFQGFMNNFSIIIGIILMIVFGSMSGVTRRYSYDACMLTQPAAVHIVLTFAMFTFATGIIFHFSYLFVSEETHKFLEMIKNPIVLISGAIILIIFLLLFFKCQDPVSCVGCSSTKLTAFSTKTAEQVGYSGAVSSLMKYYENQMTPRFSIVYCKKLYDSSYLSDNMECVAVTDPTQLPSCNTSIDFNVGAPVLAEFFIMSSFNTCNISNNSYSYVSAEMIDVAFKAGARFLDFQIFPLDQKKNSVPIVTRNNKKTNEPLQYNYVTLETCLKKVVTSYFIEGNQNTIREPLFIHLRISKNVNSGTMNNIANLVSYYFANYSGNNYLLPKEYNYSLKNLGNVPICSLYGKLIVCVSCDKILTNSMDELTNIRFGWFYSKRMEWRNIRNYYAPKEVVNWNRTKLTLITPSNTSDIYSKTSSDTDAVVGTDFPNNNDPSVPLSYGCQFVPMNLHYPDSELKKYLGLFKKNSYIVKPKNLLRNIVPTTSPIVDADGNVYTVECDVEGTFENDDQRLQYCESVRQREQQNQNMEAINRRNEKLNGGK